MTVSKSLDRVRSLAAALTATAFALSANAQTELLYCLHLDGNADNAGTAAAETITSSGTPTLVTSGMKYGTGAFKADQGSYVIAPAGGLSLEDGWTISFWLKPNGIANWQDVCGFQIGKMIYKFEKNGSNGFQMYSVSTDTPHTINKSLDVTNGNILSWSDSAAWMHVVLVSGTDGNSFDIYQNGTLHGTYVPGDAPNGTGYLTGGADADASLVKFVVGVAGLKSYSGTNVNNEGDGRKSSALLDELAIFKGRLSEKQITWLTQNAPSVRVLEELTTKTVECGTAYSVGEANAVEADVVKLNFTGDAVLTVDELPSRTYAITVPGSLEIRGTAEHPLTPDDLVNLNLADVTGEKTFVYASLPDGLAAPGAGVTYRFETAEPLATIPFVTDGSYNGKIEMGSPFTEFASEGAVYNSKTIVLDGEGDLVSTDKRLSLGNSSGNHTQVIVQKNGTVRLTKSEEADGSTNAKTPLLFAHWPSTVTWNLEGGELLMPNGVGLFGWDGNAYMTIGGGEKPARFQAYGLTYNTGHNNKDCTLTIKANGRLEIGAGNLNFSERRKVVLEGGTLAAYAPCTMTVGGGIALTEETESTLEIGEHDVTLAAAFSGEGSLVKTGSGYLKLTNVARPTFGAIEGRIELTVSATELADGAVVLKTTEAEDYAADTFAVVDAQGASVSVTKVSQEDGRVTLTLSTNSIKTDTQTSLWASDLAGTISVKNDNEEEPLVLTVDSAFPSGVTQLDVIGKVTVDVTAALASYGDVRLNITDGSSVTIKGAYPFAAIAGLGELIFDPGEGKTMTVSTDNGGFTGPCTVASGTIKMGHNKCFGAWNRSVHLLAKTTVDLGGQGNGGESGNTYTFVLEEGAKFCNYGEPSTDPKLAFVASRLELRGNAVFEAKNRRCGLTRHWNHATSVALGGHTLTIRGGNTAYFSCPTFENAGRINVTQSTTLNLAHDYSGAQPSCPTATIDVGEGSRILLEQYTAGTSFTVKNLVLNGSLERVAANTTGKYIVTGRLSGAGTADAPVQLGSDAALKLDGKACITFKKGLATTEVAGEAEGEMVSLPISLDVPEEVLSSTVHIPVMTVSAPEDLPTVTAFSGVPARWSLKVTSDGLGYYLSKPTLVINIR